MRRVVVTLDVDWAPDVAIDFAASMLADYGVRSTWFVTHESPAIDRLRAKPELFDLGIHPNFLPRSSHGSTPEEVLDHCMELVPDAVTMRTHALVQSTPLFDTVLRRTPIRCDASLLLPHAKHLEPVEYQWQGTTLLRVPYHWEDDIEMLRDRPAWDLETALGGAGLRILDFHPIHVFLNSADMKPYSALKEAVRPFSLATREDAEPFVNEGAGTRTVFEALVGLLANAGGGGTIRQLYDTWRHNDEAQRAPHDRPVAACGSHSRRRLRERRARDVPHAEAPSLSREQ